MIHDHKTIGIQNNNQVYKGGWKPVHLSNLINSDLSEYFQNNIIGNGFITKEDQDHIYFDSPNEKLQQPMDMQSLLQYYMQKYNSERLVVLSDLSEDERAREFIVSTSENKRNEIKHYLNCVSMLLTTCWLKHTSQSGCYK